MASGFAISTFFHFHALSAIKNIFQNVSLINSHTKQSSTVFCPITDKVITALPALLLPDLYEKPIPKLATQITTWPPLWQIGFYFLLN